MESARQKTATRAETFQPAAARTQVQRKAVTGRGPLPLQVAARVSSPRDPAEKEADSTANRIMRMAVPERSISRTSTGPTPKQETNEKETIRRKAEGQPNVASNVAAEIQNSLASGSPLPPGVRRFMEPRFRADFSTVRIHTNDRAARLNTQLSAQAFTVGNQIFFGKERFKPDSYEGKELIAHELTHTVQQGAAIQRREDVTVSEQSPVKVQRLGISDALDYFADQANLIPGFRMFTIVLGVNPINMSRVEANAANILRAVVEFIPGGGLITKALDNHGVFDKVGAWVEQQIKSLGMTGSAIKQAIKVFLDSLSWTDIFDLAGVWNRAKNIFTGPIDQLISFAKGLITGILTFIKNAILRPLAKLAEGTRGYDLLKAILGQDPVTGDPVPQTAETLIGGFMKLIGQEEVWNNMKKANAVPRAWAWFKGAMGALMGFVREIPVLFVNALKSLVLADIVLLPSAFAKVASVFGNFIGRFISWAGNAVWNLLEIIFDVVSPGALGYIKRTGAALKSILKNPLPFVGNLVKAAKLGFQNFAANFGGHLKAGLIDWLTGSLPGVYIPKAFSLEEIVKFVFSVLGLTWQNIRAKLVKAVGETAVKAMETGFDIVVTLVTQGPAAAWDKIKEQLANLKDIVIGGITDFVIDMVVKKAVPKLIAMFIPGAGFISAILSIYDTVMVFVNKISKIIQVVTGFINSIVAIAAGAIGAAASKVESTLAGLLSLAINFLAGFAGLGKVADKVMGVINKVRAPIDKALDWLINWIVTMAKKLFKSAVGAVKGLLNWGSVKSSFADDEGKSHSIQVSSAAPFKLMIASSPMAAAEFLSWYVGKKGADFEKDNKPRIAEIRTLISQAQAIVTRIETTEKARPDDPQLETLQRELLNKNVELSGKISSLVGSDASIGKAKEKYKLEGMTGTYGSMPKPPGDEFTADHQPQAAILQAAAEFDYFSESGELARRAAGRARAGYAINLHTIRHMAGRTYGSKGKKTKEGFLAEIRKDTKGKQAAQKRAIVVAKIKADMLSDVNAMQGVAAVGSAYWDDILKKLPGKKEEKQALVAEVSGRIISGEKQIAAQDIDSLIGPALPPAAVVSARVQMQSSLKVSNPGDPEEKEAELTAKKVVRLPGSSSFSAAGTIQRRSAGGQPNLSPNVAAEIQSSVPFGAPLPADTRRLMEPRFAADFGNVRIHTGEKAARLNQELGAQAFTVGNSIFFSKGAFQPGNRAGQELIAHELTHTLQQGAALQRRTMEIAGKRLYLTRSGKLIELPHDLSEADAARLEAEGSAAERKLGQGPAPKPVADPRKLARQEQKPEKPKLVARGKRGAIVKGRGAARAGAAAGAAMLGAVGPGKVAQYLAAKGAPVLSRGIGLLQKLRQNEQTHDDAAQKLQQSEKAVVIPPSEGQSKSNAGQVNLVGERSAPVVDENRGKQKLQQSLAANIPKNIEDVDNFKRDSKAQHMGADVTVSVLADKNAVTGTFADLRQTPAPMPPEHLPEALPPQEKAPATPAMNLGQGALAPLLKEHTDLSSYTREADGRLQEEGVTQEQLDMVDSGDLADANKEKKGLEKTAQTGPQEVQSLVRQRGEQVGKNLQQEEQAERNKLTAKRKAGLGATAQRQKAAKSALEKKRDEVAGKINGIYQTAQDKVKKRLADLETQSIKRFDDGNARATREFEDNVKRELDAYKADRYSGWFGWARKAKDWLLGMDDLPKVKEIFERNRTAFVNTVNRLVDDISADNKRVVKECKEQLDSAKKEIKDYVDKLEPGLKGIGAKAAEEMDTKLADLDQFIGQKEEELQNSLKDKQTAAIKAIDEKIEKMKDEMSGALAKLGKLLLWAAKKFFTWALEKFGVSLSTIEGIISKGVAVLKAIFTGPIRFVKNLINAASTGFENFGKNFITHLKNAVFEWLTGSLDGLVLPASWDLKGILSVVFQILGITYQNIRAHLVKYIPEPVVKTLETTFALVKTLITEGPMAAWEQLKQIANDMKEAFVTAVKEWVKWAVVKEAIKTVLAIFIPGAGIIRAIIAIYDTIVFFIQRAKDIMQMIGSFLGSIAEIAAGNIAAAADALENGLARGLKLVIDFLARFLRLSGITAKIREAIQKIRGKVDDVLDRVAQWIVSLARKVGGAVKQAGGKILAMVFPKKKLVVDGETHTMEVEEEGQNYEIFVNSNRMRISEIIKKARNKGLPAGPVDTLENEYKAWRAMPKPLNPEDEKKEYAKRSEKYQKVYELSEPVVEKLFAGLDVTKIAWGGLDHLGRATRVQANPLTKRGVKGSAPGEAIPGHDTDLKYKGEHVSYIRTHLLHHGLGGPGRSFNLTPTSNSINQKIFNQVEEKALKEVDKGETLVYTVDVDYKNPTAAQLNDVKPQSKKELLKFSAYKLTYNVTYKDSHKRVVPRFEENNWS